MSDATKSVSAVIVTYNRLELLKEVIESLKIQTQKINDIIIINNSSTDGTSDWLEKQEGLTIITQPNLGSSGGQYTGMKTAIAKSNNWIWIMDDDVVPVPDCLENLLKDVDSNIIRAPLRYKANGEVFYNDAVGYNLNNPFRSFWLGIISENDLKNEYIPAIGLTFEGPLIHRKIIEDIGFPEKKFFLFGDDTEYFIRASKMGYKMIVCRDAVLNRKLTVLNINDMPAWKWYFVVRNLVAINVLHGSLSVRIIRPIIILLTSLTRCKNFKSVKSVIRGFTNGFFYKSEN